jgi:hypothetical protein
MGRTPDAAPTRSERRRAAKDHCDPPLARKEYGLNAIIHTSVGRNKQAEPLPDLRSLDAGPFGNDAWHHTRVACAVPALACATLTYVNNRGYGGNMPSFK